MTTILFHQCSGQGPNVETNSCYTGSDKVDTTPVCGDGKIGDQGKCVKCSEKTDSVETGTGAKQGSCPLATLKCCSDGSCKETCP